MGPEKQEDSGPMPRYRPSDIVNMAFFDEPIPNSEDSKFSMRAAAETQVCET